MVTSSKNPGRQRRWRRWTQMSSVSTQTQTRAWLRDAHDPWRGQARPWDPVVGEGISASCNWEWWDGWPCCSIPEPSRQLVSREMSWPACHSPANTMSHITSNSGEYLPYILCWSIYSIIVYQVVLYNDWCDPSVWQFALSPSVCRGMSWLACHSPANTRERE